jgi:pyruvate formate-lyase/glycerol dehydratase family glycyl radical enzyme
MTMTSEQIGASFEDRVKRSVPFDWGYGSTPRTKQLRDAIYWKASVATNTLENAALGLARVTFRPGVKIDMDRARIATAAFRETEGQPAVLQFARMVEKLCDEMPIFIKNGELIVGDANGGADRVRWYPETNVDWMPEAVTTGGFSTIVTDEERREIVEDICPYWQQRSMVGLIKSSLPEEMAPTILSHGAFITNTWEAGLVTPSYDWEVLFREGLTARIASAEASLKELDEKVTEMDPAEYREKRCNWQAMVRCGKAIIRYGERLSALAGQQAAQENDEKRKRELEEMAEVLQRVPANPPQTLHESLQFYWTVEVVAHYFARWGSASGARLDQIWWPYHEADLKAGRIVREDAVELIECLFMKIQELGCPLHWPPQFAGTSGSNTLYTAAICGTTPDGEDASNDLSCIIMEALANLRLTQPPIGLRYHPNIAPEVIRTAIDLGRTGLGHPSYFNEDLLEKWGLMRGLSPEDAKKVQACGCVANNVMGKAQTATGLVNVGVMNAVMVLEDILYRNDEEIRSGHIVFPAGKKATEMQSAEELLEAYLERVKYYAKIGQVSWNIAQQVLMDHKPDPSNSLLNDETLQRGIDLLRFNKEGDTWPSIIIFGAINAADSLAAIQKLVFEEKKYTIEELLTALRANWNGHEVMRQDFLNAPKHGNDDDYADDWTVKLLVKLDETISAFKDAWGCSFTIDGSTATGYSIMGSITGASPDGRGAGASLADGTRSPMVGTDKNGPTAVLNSVGKVPFMHTELFNQRFMPQFLEGDNRKLFADYLKVWHKRGIPHIQFNVVSSEELRAAKAQPEEHSDLIVRVAGYSAHFIDLAEHTQDSIIERTEQSFN